MAVLTEKRVIFRTREGGLLDVYEKSVDGGGDKICSSRRKSDKEPTDVSPDGRTLAFGVSNTERVDAAALSRGSLPIPYLQSGFNEEDARFSPDGRWVAFESV